jgi:hypothetical protein
MRKRKIKIVLGFLLVFFLIFLFRPYERVNYKMVDQRLRALEEPLKSVNICCFGDGGSIGFEIVDREGKTLAFCLPSPLDDPSLTYNNLFVGSLYYTESGASEVLNGHHTKLRLAEMLRSHPGFDATRDLIVYHLSGRYRDLLRFLSRYYVFHVYDE